MKTKVSPSLVGAFVLGALALAFVALLVFGGVNFFAHPERFEVYFHESTHGLDLGSPVKLEGVRVGRVVGLNVRYDTKTDESVVAVVCELEKSQIRDAAGEPFDVTVPGRLKTLVDRGLRAQLGVNGIATGLLFVELDFLDPKAHPADESPAASPYTIVPAVPSTIAGFQASAEAILGKIGQVDFAGLSTQLEGLLVDLRHQVAGLDLKGAVDQWKTTGAAVQTLVQSADVKKSLENFDATLDDLRVTLRKLDTQVDATGPNLQASLTHLQDTLKEFSATAVTVRRFVAQQQNLGDDANKALSSLGDAADAVKRLADFLERNPNALLSGKTAPPPLPASDNP